jgi:predicted nucleic-acid-binding Zn-ribbon protein
MRTTQVCPKCRGRKFVVVEEVRQPVFREGAKADVQPFYPAAAAIPPQGVVSRWRGTRDVLAGGRLEAWICTHCGLTEWYALDVEELVHAAAIEGSGVRSVDLESEPSPYR